MPGLPSIDDKIESLAEQIRELQRKYDAIRSNEVKRQFPDDYIGQIYILRTALEYYKQRERNNMLMDDVLSTEKRIVELEAIYDGIMILPRSRLLRPLSESEPPLNQELPTTNQARRRRGVESRHSSPPPLSDGLHELQQEPQELDRILKGLAESLDRASALRQQLLRGLSSPESSLSQGSLSSERSIQQQEGITLYPLDMFIVNEDIDGVRLKLEQLKQQGELIDSNFLSLAITNGNIQIVVILLEHIKSFSNRENQLELYRSAFELAVRNHDVLMLATILKFYNPTILPNETDTIISKIVALDQLTLKTFLSCDAVDVEIKKRVQLIIDSTSFCPTKELDESKLSEVVQFFNDHCYDMEFIRDPVFIVGENNTVFDGGSLKKVVDLHLLLKINKEQLKDLNILLSLINSNVGSHELAIALNRLNTDVSLSSFIEQQSSLLGNIKIREILLFSFPFNERFKTLFGHIDTEYPGFIKLINDIIDNPIYSDELVEDLIVRLTLIHVLKEAVSNIEYNIHISSYKELTHPETRVPYTPQDVKSARLFMDVCLIAINGFKMNHSDQYVKWGESEDELKALEEELGKLMRPLDVWVGSRLTVAGRALKICTEFSQKHRDQSLTKQQIQDLINDSGLTFGQLKKLDEFGIAKINIPAQEFSNKDFHLPASSTVTVYPTVRRIRRRQGGVN